MKILLWVLAGLSLIEGVTVYTQAESAVHQILASISMLAFAVFVSAAAIVGAIEKAGSDQIQSSERASEVTAGLTGTDKGLGKQVLKEMEAGSIHTSLWDEAKSVAEKSGNSVTDEYVRLRIEYLNEK